MEVCSAAWYELHHRKAPPPYYENNYWNFIHYKIVTIVLPFHIIVFVLCFARIILSVVDCSRVKIGFLNCLLIDYLLLRIHYRIYYALYLLENDSTVTCHGLKNAIGAPSGQQSLIKYRFVHYVSVRGRSCFLRWLISFQHLY